MVDDGDPAELVEPEGAAVAAFQQVVGKAIGMHGNFNVMVGVAGGADHGKLLLNFIEYKQVDMILQGGKINIVVVKQ
jgi:hypothetical protein